MLNRIVVALLLTVFLSACAHMRSSKNSEGAFSAGESSKSLIAAGEYREALRELLRAEELDASNSEVQYLLATVYLIGFNRLEEAKEHVLKAIKLAKEP